uniref:Uncharacterized protein n=1 Tax=Pithovirus LCDPAC01 TaxID=2506600 RepID=A0A4D5XEG4_9VIRU|nr:MAG: hypothetical protein LCDPAC01_02470 [Pithovirus LCDPAC01]
MALPIADSPTRPFFFTHLFVGSFKILPRGHFTGTNLFFLATAPVLFTHRPDLGLKTLSRGHFFEPFGLVDILLFLLNCGGKII